MLDYPLDQYEFVTATAQRARALGLPFSRYVQWCVEAELDGSSLGDRFKV